MNTTSTDEKDIFQKNIVIFVIARAPLYQQGEMFVVL